MGGSAMKTTKKRVELSGEKIEKTPEVKKELVTLRNNLGLFLLKNPNYFGNLSGPIVKKFKPVLLKKNDTYFEELTCISFDPKTKDLSGIIAIKRNSGYNGGPCSEGSKEYVRFYIDYDRDGSWIDAGLTSFDAHDLTFSNALCYAVHLHITPKKNFCCEEKPILPRIRGILSWNTPPPADDPNWTPIWGNHLDSDIQIDPLSSLICAFLKKSIIDQTPEIIEKLSFETSKSIQKYLPKTATLASLKEAYGKKVDDARIVFPSLQLFITNPNSADALYAMKLVENAGFNLDKITDAFLKPKFDTTYEELKCIGLDRDTSILHGAIVIKRSCGYSGNLCEQGSREYVAFYIDFGSGWEYVGTTSVQVHDIPDIPAEGLWYNIQRPVSLSAEQKEWCESGKAKVRAILSWDVPPPPDTPDYVAHWGDWEECNIEIRPLPPGVIPGQGMVPYIETVGSMPICCIDPSGYANGENASGLVAKDSPFDGNIRINGLIFYEPDYYNATPGISQVKYRILIKQPSHSDFQPLLKAFTIHVSRINNGIFEVYFVGGHWTTQQPVTQTPNPLDGAIFYYPDGQGSSCVSVSENLLGVFRPSEEGLHEMYIEVFDPVTSDWSIKSNTVKFMVDMTYPTVDIEITSGTGNCGTFTQGDIIEGTFSISDAHCHSVSLSVTPSTEAHGATPEIVGVGTSSLAYSTLSLPGTGIAGTWTLKTLAMDPCGYNIRIHGEDRTIVNSSWIGHEKWDIEGFCLKKKSA